MRTWTCVFLRISYTLATWCTSQSAPFMFCTHFDEHLAATTLHTQWILIIEHFALTVRIETVTTLISFRHVPNRISHAVRFNWFYLLSCALGRRFRHSLPRLNYHNFASSSYNICIYMYSICLCDEKNALCLMNSRCYLFCKWVWHMRVCVCAPEKKQLK